MMTQKEMDTERIIALIDETKGNVLVMSKKLGCSRNTLMAFINSHVTCQTALANAREGMLDNAESMLYKAVLNGAPWAICFFLKTQGKRRGYVERQEVTGAEGGPVAIKTIEVVLPPEDAGDGTQ